MNTNLPNNLPPDVYAFCQNCESETELMAKLTANPDHLISFFETAVKDNWRKDKIDPFNEIITTIENLNNSSKLSEKQMDKINKIGMSIYKAAAPLTQAKILNLFETTINDKNYAKRLQEVKDRPHFMNKCFTYIEHQTNIKCVSDATENITINVEKSKLSMKDLDQKIVSTASGIFGPAKVKINFVATGTESIEELTSFIEKYGKNIEKLDLQNLKDKVDDVFTKKLIKHCPNLSQLFIKSRMITDAALLELPTLTNLTVLTLNLSGSQVTALPDSLSMLTNLTALTLDLSDSKVTKLPADISKLTNLTALTLNLRGSPVTALPDLSKLINLTALTLDLGETKVTALPDLSPLINLTALTLDLRETKVTALPDLSKLTNLTKLMLHLGGTKVTALPDLSPLTNLTWLALYLWRSEVTALPDFKTLTNLTALTLNLLETKVTALPDLSPLTNLTALTLDLSRSEVAELPDLNRLINLTKLTLNLSESKVATLPDLSRLTNLTALTLDIWGSKVTALPDGLSMLTNLTELALGLLESKVPEENRLEVLKKLLINDLERGLKFSNSFAITDLSKLAEIITINLPKDDSKKLPILFKCLKELPDQLFKDYQDIKTSFHKYLLDRLNADIEDQKEARELSSKIIDNQTKLLLGDEDDVFQKAIEVYIVSDPATAKDRKNPYNLFSTLKKILSSEKLLELDPDTTSGKKEIWNLEKLREKPITYTFADRPKEVTPDSLDQLFEAMEKRINSLPEEQKKQTLEGIASSYLDSFATIKAEVKNSSVINTSLQQLKKPEEVISNTSYHLYAIIKYIIDSSDTIEKGSILSNKEERLLNFSSGVKNCTTGQQDGINRYYEFAGLRKAEKEEVKEEAWVINNFVQDVVQKYLNSVISSKKLLNRLTKIDESKLVQEAHQTLYLKNRLFQQLNLDHTLTLDKYSGVIYDQLIDIRTKELFNAFFDCFDEKEMVKLLKIALTEKFKEGGIPLLFDYLTNIVKTPKDFIILDEDYALKEVTEACAKEILLHSGYFRLNKA